MNLFRTRSQAIWLFKVVTPRLGFLPELVEAIARRYQFQGYPKSFQELSGSDFTFSIGKYQNRQIDELKIYADGAVVNSSVTVEDNEAFLTDLAAWMARDLGVQINPYPKLRRLLYSELEVQLDIDLSALLKPVAEFSRILHGMTSEIYDLPSQFQPSGFYIHADMSSIKTGAPGAFRIERRLGESYDSNTYFTTAPLPTSKHMELLTVLEQLAHAKGG